MPPPSTMLLVHFGSGLRAIDQLIVNSFRNYRAYRPILRGLGRGGAGSLTLSVFAVREGITVDYLLSGPGARWPLYGISAVAEVTGAGFELWPTTVMHDGVRLPYSDDHFDIPLVSGDIRIADEYRSLSRADRRAARDLVRGQFERLLVLFEPRLLRTGVAKRGT